MIQTLSEKGTQIWYADDASAIGELDKIRSWFDKLMKIGPAFGYFPEPTKSLLVVKEPLISQANALFSDLGIKIATSGRLLGSVVGDHEGTESFVTNKVNEWSGHIRKLSSIAHTQPQAAYIALIKSLQCEWNFLQRVVPDCGTLFTNIENTICDHFLPALFGSECTQNERKLYALPLRMGGLNIGNPTSSTTPAYHTSRKATLLLANAIKGSDQFTPSEHIENVHNAISESRKQKTESGQATFNSVINEFDTKQRRSIYRSKDSLSSWLNVLPIEKDHFDLSANEFRDALSLRYAKPLLQLPSTCDGCGELFFNHPCPRLQEGRFSNSTPQRSPRHHP